MGARRKLFGDEETRGKQGLAHMISGSVSNLMAWCLIKIVETYPVAFLILNKHDGAIVAFPNSLDPVVVEAAVREIVEREWEIGPGIRMHFPATWERRMA